MRRPGKKERKERQDHDAAIAELELATTEVEPLVAANRWDAALARFDTAEKAHPALRSIADFLSARARIENYRNDAARSFAQTAEKARRGSRRANTESPPAWRSRPGPLYPEKPEGPALLKQITERMLDSKLVPVSATIKGREAGRRAAARRTRARLHEPRIPDGCDRGHERGSTSLRPPDRPPGARQSSGPDGISGPAWNSCP